jgi:hypothetical protein
MDLIWPQQRCGKIERHQLVFCGHSVNFAAQVLQFPILRVERIPQVIMRPGTLAQTLQGP